MYNPPYESLVWPDADWSDSCETAVRLEERDMLATLRLETRGRKAHVVLEGEWAQPLSIVVNRVAVSALRRFLERIDKVREGHIMEPLESEGVETSQKT